MTKLFRNSKQILSFVIAFAIIAVSLFTGVVINSEAACDGTVTSWTSTSGTLSLLDPDSANSETNPYIIDNANEFAYFLQEVCNGDTSGKYYKVADGVKAFNMNRQGLDLSGDLDVNTVYEMYQNASTPTANYWSRNFAGSLDGNGVIIYGLNGADKNTGGLFDKLLDGAVIKNLTLKNCYFKGDSVGAIAGRQNANNIKVTVSNCVVNGCVMLTYRDNDPLNYCGVMLGRFSNSQVMLDNCLVYNNIAHSTDVSYSGYEINDVKYGLIGGASETGSKISNCILLGCLPFVPRYEWAIMRDVTFENIYCDMLNAYDVTENTAIYRNSSGKKYKEYGKLTQNADGSWSLYGQRYNVNDDTEVGKLTATRAAGSFYGITEEQSTGAAAKEAMENLDWTGTWFAVEDGMPQLRKFHNLTAVTPSAEGHGYECADCDIDAVVAHIWDGNECTECGYTCNHTAQTVTKTDAATCVSKEIVYSTCNNCKQELTEQVGAEPTGHVVTYVEADPADCTNTGIYGYWHCSVCDGNFLAETEEEAKWAAMDSSYANPETDLIMPADPVGGHTQKSDADGVIVIVDGANGHYYECSVCDGKLNHKSEELAEDEVVKHDFSASVCKECGWACTEHNYELTGNILVVGDCYTDHEDEMKCTICGKQESKVTKASHNIVAVAEVKATDKMEGTKAHYQCTECKSIYADAEGKTSVTKASLVIPKQLPAGYENTYEGTGGTTAPENADTSTTSPATSDGIIVVAAAVALMGAAFVIFRKARKA